MTEDTKPKEDSKPKKEQEPRNVTYDNFLDLQINHGYFLTIDPLELIAAAPKVRRAIVEALSTRPYEEGELYKFLEKKDPLLVQALSYVQEQVEFDGENFDSCRRALELISDGIEVRINGDNNYFGLKSKLDGA